MVVGFILDVQLGGFSTVAIDLSYRLDGVPSFSTRQIFICFISNVM